MSENSFPIIYSQPDEKHDGGEDCCQDDAVEILAADPPSADNHDNAEYRLNDPVHKNFSDR